MSSDPGGVGPDADQALGFHLPAPEPEPGPELMVWPGTGSATSNGKLQVT